MSILFKDNDFDTLCHKFGLPHLLQTWMASSKDQEPNDYLIHEDICNMHPEDALLCIALCLKIMEKKYSEAARLLSPVQETIDAIITNYAEAALARAHFNLTQNERIDIEFVSADLRDLTKALEKIEPYLFEQDDHALSHIISALSVQASAQAEVASYVLTSFREQERQNTGLKGTAVPFLKTLPVNDNRHNRHSIF